MSENVTKTMERTERKPRLPRRGRHPRLVEMRRATRADVPAGGIFNEPHLCPDSCAAARVRKRTGSARETERRRIGTERLRKQCLLIRQVRLLQPSRLMTAGTRLRATVCSICICRDLRPERPGGACHQWKRAWQELP